MAADTVQQVKEKLTIVDVVGMYVKLARAGRHFRGLSPFNKEKTPSFYVNPERGSYYCFSSGQGGDMFTFIEKMEGVDFKGALKILADKAGVELVYDRSHAENKDKKEKLYAAMARAEAYFREQLELGIDVPGSAYAYALSRGLTKETITTWTLGYAPDGWRGLLEKLMADGFTEAELIAAGLVKEADEKKGTFYDRFRNRLMFPIRDSAGRTVAFTGRALDPNDQAKYLNSPETDLYKKSEILFGMDKAKDAIRQRGFTLLVEGQMDLLMLHQIGFNNTVALSGTALSIRHLDLMKRYSSNLVLALDGDGAGLRASQKNIISAFRIGMRIKALPMPKGMDPADLAKSNPKDLVERVQNKWNIMELFIELVKESEKRNPETMFRKIAEYTYPILAYMEDFTERGRYINLVAREIDSDPRAVLDDVIKIRQGLDLSRTPEETELLNMGRRVNSSMPVKGKRPADRFAIAMRAAIECYPDTALAERLKNEYARIIGAPSADDTPLPEHEVFEAGIAYGEHPDEHAADDLVKALEKAILTDRLADATTRLRTAETSGDEMLARAAADECRTLARALAAFS